MITDCKIIELPKVTDPRGNLTFVEENRQVPFQIKRVYYLYDVPGGAVRAGHAHKSLHQFVIAIPMHASSNWTTESNKNKFTWIALTTVFILLR